jgi:hypothetical protein
MRSTPMLFCHLAVALIAAGAVSAQAAEGPFYDPSNIASPTGKTIGYTLYRTIGCPARELLGIPCPVPEAVAVSTTPATPAASVTTPAPVATPSANIALEPAPVVVPARPSI